MPDGGVTFLGTPPCCVRGCDHRAVVKVLPVGWFCRRHELRHLRFVSELKAAGG